jgi:hypothetical protein
MTSLLKKFFFLFLMALSLSLSAQETIEKKNSSFFAGVSFSPDYCFRTLQNHAVNPATTYVFERKKQHEIPKTGYTAGLALGYLMKESIILETGIRYSSQGYKTNEIINTSIDSNGVLEKSETVKYKYNFSYIEFPLKASLLMGKKKLKFIAGAGLVAGICLYERTTTEMISPSRSVTRESPNYIYNPFNLFAIASAGMNLKLKERMDLRIEPDFKYGLLQIIDQPVTAHLWSAGISAGLYFRL